MKILVINGSSNKESFTQLNLENIIKTIKNIKKDEIEVTIMNPQTDVMLNCVGCSQCFYTGSCNLDKFDNFEKIRKLLINSDLVIFGTPVYSLNVTPYLKNFIDRIIHWAHYLRLYGKAAVILTTSFYPTNHVNSYMSFICHSLGLKVIGNINISSQDIKTKKINVNQIIEKL